MTRVRGKPLSEAQLAGKRRAYRRKKEKRGMLGCRQSAWMRQTELHTSIRGIYQEARSEWFFTTTFAEDLEGRRVRVRRYYPTLQRAVDDVGRKSEGDLELYLFNRERGLPVKHDEMEDWELAELNK